MSCDDELQSQADQMFVEFADDVEPIGSQFCYVILQLRWVRLFWRNIFCVRIKLLKSLLAMDHADFEAKAWAQALKST